MHLYPAATVPFDFGLFANPTSAYRATPLWSWNNTLDRAQLLRQIDHLKAMGMGGFHMHARTGLGTTYLGPEFMDCVPACVDRARDENMLAWLYDEDRWPSGSAGGLVTRDEAFRARRLLWTVRPPEQVEAGVLLEAYEVVLEAGRLQSYRRLDLASNDGATRPAGRVWYAYEVVQALSEWFGGQTYVDTLNPAAIRRFVEVTHERYREAVGAEFGRTIPAIFTDEPQFIRKQALAEASSVQDLEIPFTSDLFETYLQAYGDKLEDRLPELFWDLAQGRASVSRYRYHDHVCERFATAFADTIGEWCARNNLALTGHMMEEPTLQSQAAALGEAMRSYRAFHLPGIDVLCDSYEFNTAKQAQSAAHQYGRPGVLSELYGVTNWDFDFAGHKGQGDWQAALGITVRVPHLTWVSMAGEAKRDYPASIGYQSPWFREYPLIEDHFARVNVALTRGMPLVRLGVIHPIESYWLCSGPLAETQLERDDRETRFSDLTNWLLFGTLDFDFICESLLPTQFGSTQSDSKFAVGAMAYDVVLVPGLKTVRSTTMDRLEAFSADGGTIIFIGEVPELVDACPSTRARDLARRCPHIDFSRTALLPILEPWREIAAPIPSRESHQRMAYPREAPDESLLHTIRVDGADRYVFLCNTDREFGRDAVPLRLRGLWHVIELDTMSGETRSLAASRQDGWTVLERDFPAHGHLLLRLKPEPTEAGGSGTVHAVARPREVARLDDPMPITLSEPNVLLLDRAAYRLDNGAWQVPRELLQLENIARSHFGLPPAHGYGLQPWIDPRPAPILGEIELCFQWHSEVALTGTSLALEPVEHTQIWLDDIVVPVIPDGWWVDEAIRTLPLPPMAAGTHELRLRVPFNRTTHLEWCYLLGDFGVNVRGKRASLTAPVRELAWGDWTSQGLPFYAGNVIYHTQLRPYPGPVDMHVPHFKAPLLAVAMDGERFGSIAFAPYRLRLPEGEVPRSVDITAFGNRANAFGAVHNAETNLRWFGPDAWRTTGAAWSDEYRLKPMGVLSAPIIEA